MTAAADIDAAAVTSSLPSQRPPGLAQGVRLLGEYEESGLEESPFIARRPDGQLVQLPRLLYLVAERLDGRATYEDIAREVSGPFGKEIGPGDVKLLVEDKLGPLSLLAGSEASTPAARRDDPLLALKLKTAVIPPRLVRAGTTLFYPLFFPPVMVAVVAGLIALDYWLFVTHGVAQGFRHLLEQPLYLLVVLGLVVAGTTFHEFGHATACRYGGAQPGAMGVGLYVIWPAFYTDVNDAYRLGRWGRIRTDLGGVYFNAIFALGMAGVYFLTGLEVFLLLVVVQHFQMLQQSLPFLRLDGYYVVSDVTGVPDLFARIGPILRSLIPGRSRDPRAIELKPWVRRVVTAWVLSTIPVVLLVYAILVISLPRLISTGTASVRRHAAVLSTAVAGSEWSDAGAAGVQIALLVLPTVGATYVLARTAKRIGLAAWRGTDQRPTARVTMAVAALAVAVFATVALWPDDDYRPIRPGERGTIFDAATALSRGRAPGPAPVAASPIPPVSAAITPAPSRETAAGGSAEDPFESPQDGGSATADPRAPAEPDVSPSPSPSPSASASPSPTP